MLSKEDNELLTRVGPGTPMGDYVRRFWVPCLLSEEIPTPESPPVRVRMYGEDLVAFRDTAGRVGLLERYCPHRQASLFFGRNEDHGLRCVYHGWKFDVNGRCLDMPAEPPEASFKDKVRAVSYPAREQGGVIWGCLGPTGTEPELPKLEWALVPDTHRYVSKSLQQCNYLQALEGGIDSSHINYLHSTLDRSKYRLGVADGALRTVAVADPSPRYFLNETSYGAQFAARRTVEGGNYYWRITQWMLPFFQIIPSEPDAVVTGNCYVPMDDDNTLVFRISWHPDRPLTEGEVTEFREGGYFHTAVKPGTYLPVQNRDNDYLIDREAQRTETFTGIHGIQAQDQAVIESMSGSTIVNRAREHLGTSDKAIIAARRRLLREVRRLQEGVEPAAARDADAFSVRSASLLLAPDVPWETGAAHLLAPRVIQ